MKSELEERQEVMKKRMRKMRRTNRSAWNAAEVEDERVLEALKSGGLEAVANVRRQGLEF